MFEQLTLEIRRAIAELVIVTEEVRDSLNRGTGARGVSLAATKLEEAGLWLLQADFSRMQEARNGSTAAADGESGEGRGESAVQGSGESRIRVAESE